MPGKPASKFSFQRVPVLDRHGVDVSRDDILQNLVSREDQLMNGSTPWRGPREKSTLLNADVNSEFYLPWRCCLRLHCCYGYVNSIFHITSLTNCW